MLVCQRPGGWLGVNFTVEDLCVLFELHIGQVPISMTGGVCIAGRTDAGLPEARWVAGCELHS
jgi:hypothetical protein